MRYLMLTTMMVFSVLANAGVHDLSRAKLLNACLVPDKREMPLDAKGDPCADFHEYVCGPVEKSFQLPADRSSWTFAFSDNAEKLLYAKKKFFRLIEEGYNPKTKRGRQMKNVYLACMNPQARSEEEKAEVSKELKVIQALKSNEDLQKLMASRFFEPEYNLVEFGSIPNQDKPELNDLYVGAEIMSFPEKSYYENKELVADFQKVAELFYKTIGLDEPEKRAQALVKFEKSFAKISPTPAEMRQRYSARTYMPREDFIKKYPEMGLGELWKKIPAKVQIRNFTPESMEFVSEQLKSQNLETWKDVVLFHALASKMDDAYPEFFNKYFALKQKYFGAPATRPVREERCTKMVMGSFGMELDQELIPILFKNFPQKRVVELAERVRHAILDGLKENTWLSEEARKQAIEKMKVASLNLVKPNRESDWDFLPIKSYSATAPLKNAKTIHMAELEKLMKELKEKRNRHRWELSPLTVNAYYTPSDNQFFLMMGILQFPFFDAGMSDIENLGAMGAVVGHELGHGIDDQGSKYDSTGKLRQWMTMKDMAEFAKRGQKFVEQFDKIGHNGRLTLGENIGDHVGVTFAFKAAFKDMKEAKPEDIKKFFISYARVWCSVDRPDFAKMRLKTDPHSLGWARINEQVMHQEAFQGAFACKKGDKMFLPPDERVRIW